jgi:eukaryotic-like serine/threonine-protein kinase
MDLPVQRVGCFEILGHLATGGMAEILLGHASGPSGFERVAVIKRVLPHLASEPRFAQMFLDEARIAAQIRHPNVVQIHELASEGDELFIVMEYLEGESVAGLLRRLIAQERKLLPEVAAHIVAEACSGLHAAHELLDHSGRPLGVVHRDVSPQNIFVTYDGAVKILDFGIAVAKDRVTKTETGQLKGKFEYMAPEQCLGKALDRRADVFALGAVLYEITLQRRLFKRQNQLLTLRAVTTDPIPVPSTLDAKYPRELERVLLRALSRSRSGRYRTAADMRRDLIDASRSLDPKLVGDEALKELMQQLFEERIRAKRELLRCVRGGSNVTSLPAAETDQEVEIPAFEADAETADGETMSSAVLAPSATERDPGRRLRFGASRLALALAVPLALLLWLVLPRSRPPALAGDVFARPVALAATLVRSSAPEQIALRLLSQPEARVTIAGSERGTTPTTVKLDRSSNPTSITFSRQGYQSVTREFAPEAAGSLSVTLLPESTVRARKAHPARPARAPSGYAKW